MGDLENKVAGVGETAEMSEETVKKPEEKTGKAEKTAEGEKENAQAAEGEKENVQAAEGLQEEMQTAGKRKKAGWIAAGVVIVLMAAAVIGYITVANYYKTHFLPGTTVNHIVSDNMEAAEIAAQLELQLADYELTVIGRDGAVLGVLNAEDVGLKVTGALSGTEEALAAQEPMKWPLSYLGRQYFAYEVVCGKEFDAALVRTKLDEWEALDEQKMELPEDAYISDYLPETKSYEIIPETEGNALDVEKVEELVLAAIDAGETALDVAAEDCYIPAEVTSEDPKLVKTVEELNRMLATTIIYDWNGSEVVLDADTIHEWILEDDKKPGSYMLDEEAVAAFVAAQAKKYDTYGKHRYFTTALGETIYVLNGGYGWKVEREDETAALIELIKEGAVTDREPIYWVKGMQKGQEDIGSSYVEIDLTHQHLYVFWKGEIVLETDFVSGDVSKGNTTPGGLFRLTYKTTDAVLRGRDYVTPVKYWMPFNGNIGMHDATWRSTFGGEIYLTDGSHGCINLPLDKAQAIYGYVSTGFPIICYYY